MPCVAQFNVRFIEASKRQRTETGLLPSFVIISYASTPFDAFELLTQPYGAREMRFKPIRHTKIRPKRIRSKGIMDQRCWM